MDIIACWAKCEYLKEEAMVAIIHPIVIKKEGCPIDRRLHLDISGDDQYRNPKNWWRLVMGRVFPTFCVSSATSLTTSIFFFFCLLSDHIHLFIHSTKVSHSTT